MGTSSHRWFTAFWVIRIVGEVDAAFNTAEIDCGDVSICRRLVGDPAESPSPLSLELLVVYEHVSFLLVQVWQGLSPLHFCFRRLQESQAWAVRWRLSSGTLGRVMMGRERRQCGEQAPRHRVAI
jgi:hypothetical protein